MLKRLLATVVLATATLAAQTTPSPNLAGIAHIALRVRDLDASIAFYQKLGFVKAFDLSRDGKVYEAFIKINDRQFIELYPVDAKNPQPGFLHVCFEANDIQSVHDFYVAQGLKPIDVRKAGAGNLLFTMPGPMTPQGAQNMEYTQYMPGSLHSKDFGQHLGADRIATKLTSVEIAAEDPAAANAFYTGKIGAPMAGRVSPGFAAHVLPGTVNDTIVIVPSASLGLKAEIVLSAPDAAAAKLALKVSGLKLEASGVELLDPDGNRIEVEQTSTARIR
jgi:catechol 2,3-dioxygenase-like lactoylglutathione lyase family enzyme